MASPKRSDGEGSLYQQHDPACGRPLNARGKSACKCKWRGALVVDWHDGKPVRKRVTAATRSGAAAQVTTKTGSGTLHHARAVAEVYVPAGEMHVITGASIGQIGSTGVLAWMMDATTAETIGGTVRLPDDWATYDMTVLWAPTTADAGLARFDTGRSFLTVGSAIGTSFSATPSPGSTAPGVTGQLVSHVVASGATNTAGRPLAFRLIRSATDATYDTYPADAGVVAVVFSRAS